MVKITDKNKGGVLPFLSTAVLVTVLAFSEQKQQFHHHLEHLRVHESFLVLASIMALTNLTGLPEKAVKEQWETSGFGDAFFPTTRLNVQEKRILAGTLEFAGIIMAASDLAVGALLGYILLAIMYTRGALCNARLGNSTGKVALVSAGALISAWLACIEVNQFIGAESWQSSSSFLWNSVSDVFMRVYVFSTPCLVVVSSKNAIMSSCHACTLLFDSAMRPRIYPLRCIRND